jgi:hypothetical protein
LRASAKRRNPAEEVEVVGRCERQRRDLRRAEFHESSDLWSRTIRRKRQNRRRGKEGAEEEEEKQETHRCELGSEGCKARTRSVGLAIAEEEKNAPGVAGVREEGAEEGERLSREK